MHAALHALQRASAPRSAIAARALACSSLLRAAATPLAAFPAAAAAALPRAPARGFAQIHSFDDDEGSSRPKSPADPLASRERAFQPPRHPRARDAVHGIGVPSVHATQGITPRRDIRPRGVQAIPAPMKTFTEGPRELGNPVIRSFFGKVTSNKMNKTIAVEVAQYYRHPKYRKYIKTSKKFLAHDENEECAIGDVVEIRVSRRFSKRKHFVLHKIVRPKLPIDLAADRFVEHAPSWRQDILAPKQAKEETAPAAAASAHSS